MPRTFRANIFDHVRHRGDVAVPTICTKEQHQSTGAAEAQLRSMKRLWSARPDALSDVEGLRVYICKRCTYLEKRTIYHIGHPTKDEQHDAG